MSYLFPGRDLSSICKKKTSVEHNKMRRICTYLGDTRERREREIENATLLTLKMEDGTMSQGIQVASKT